MSKLTQWALMVALVFICILALVATHKFVKAMQAAEFWYSTATNAVYLAPTNYWNTTNNP